MHKGNLGCYSKANPGVVERDVFVCFFPQEAVLYSQFIFLFPCVESVIQASLLGMTIPIPASDGLFNQNYIWIRTSEIRNGTKFRETIEVFT